MQVMLDNKNRSVIYRTRFYELHGIHPVMFMHEDASRFAHSPDQMYAGTPSGENV